jgi:hypothetical protein
MKHRLFTILACVVSLSILFALFPNATASLVAQGQQPPPAKVTPPPQPPLPPDNVGWQMATDGRKYGSADAQLHSQTRRLAPQTTGGPDDFGYVWNDTTSYNWLDATAGTNTGITGDDETGLVNIGFPFKFYGQAWTQAYLSTNGFLAFGDSDAGCCGGFPIPLPSVPNDVIAPYWNDLTVSSGYNNGAIYILNGGTTPNRYFVIEWKNVTDCCQTGATDYKTFEAILFENGNIKFQYQILNGYLESASVGIEDALGLDGLQILRQQPGLSNGKVYYITYPPPSARVSVFPTSAGAFGAPGAVVQFTQTIRNTGELGSDTYDLFPTSAWPMMLYDQDGTTPLTDTGSIAQGSSKTIVVKVTVPATATLGQSNNGQLIVQSSVDTGKSKTLSLQAAVPAEFAQSYTQNYSPYAGFYHPANQTVRHTTVDSGYAPAIATTPDGKVIQVWSEYRTNSNGKGVYELYYAMFDRWGNVVRAPARITDNSSATTNAYDYTPAVAVAPNGNVGIVWYRYNYNSSNSQYNYNIYLMILNGSGGIVTTVNLTSNSLWGTSNAVNVPRFYYPNIAATTDNRFAMAWTRRIYTGSTYQYTTWYAVQDTNGNQIKAATQFSGDTRSYYPNLTPLVDGSVFLSQYASGNISYGRLDSSGNILTGLTLLSSGGNLYSDAIQMPNGNIVLVWSYYGDWIRYAVLNSSLGIVIAVTDLPQISSIGDDNPSVTRFGNRAVITWNDACCNYNPNLYYALLDGVGNLLTPPMIFASDNTNFSMQLPYNGQGNTYLPDITPPTSQANSPLYAVGPFRVTWSGSDADSGIESYDVQVRDGTLGTWTTWLANTRNVSTTFASGVVSHTYYFRSIAHDWIGNVEAGLPANGDSNTTIATYQVGGQVINNRHQAIFNAMVIAQPSALNNAVTDYHGNHNLFFNTAGTYTLTASRLDKFGALPPQYNVAVTSNVSGTDFVLPPMNDAVTNGGWETGDLTGWSSDPAITPTIEITAAHTGWYGLRLDNVGSGSGFLSYITQSVSIPITWTKPTLSLMYRVKQGSGDNFSAVVTNDSSGITSTVSVTPGNWIHAWVDLSAFSGQTVTLKFGFQNQIDAQQIYLDEISLGDTQQGVYPVYLPLVQR